MKTQLSHEYVKGADGQKTDKQMTDSMSQDLFVGLNELLIKFSEDSLQYKFKTATKILEY